MNLANGYLDCRKHDYKSLKKLLVSSVENSDGLSNRLFQKTIPLNAPTEIELKPGVSLRVTLLDVGSRPSPERIPLIIAGKSLCWSSHVPH